MNLTSNGIEFRYSGKNINIEEAIRIVSEKRNTNKETLAYNKSEKSNMSELDHLDWKEVNETVRQTAQTIGSTVPKNTAYFVPNRYVCPHCNNNLSKVLVNTYSLHKGNTKYGIIDRVFTCKNCQSLMIPYYGEPLNSGGYAIAFVPPTKYQSFVEMLDYNSRGTPGNPRTSIH